jgi:hypothetical protein
VENSRWSRAYRTKGQLAAGDREPADIDDQVRELLEKLTDDLEVWSGLSHRFQVELFCGWFMRGGDEGIGVSPSTMAALSQRGIELGICLYAPSSSDDEHQVGKDE